MIRQIFEIVARSLSRMAGTVGLSYDEINIIVYYSIIPLTWAAMIDRLYKFHYLKITYALLVAVVFLTRKDFSAFCTHLFDLSARFLSSFQWCYMNYIAASVVFCVVIPLIIYGVLGYLLFKQP